jgi:glycosyltransferase involved in cell wall biosynthesis
VLIAVNTRMLRSGKMEGIGNFTYEAFRRITVAHPEHQFLFLFDRKYDQEFIFSPNVIPVIVPPPARHPFLWYIWCQWSLPAVFKKYKPDLFVGTDGYLSLRTKTKQLSVIHDIHFMHQPEDMPFFIRQFFLRMFPKFSRRADRIVTVSEFTADDVVKIYGIERRKIDVVYNGAADGFKPLEEKRKEQIRLKFSGGKPYFLFIGAIHKRKNISRLLHAFEKFKESISNPVQLIFAGNKRWWTDEMDSVLKAMNFKNEVIFTGRISDEDLYDITGAALAITYVSAFEGFGIPIVEGMKAGVPVLTSNITAMPEVAGNAALLCDPFSVESIYDGLVKLYNDEDLRSGLIAAGHDRQRNFSWDKTAEGLWEAIVKTANN